MSSGFSTYSEFPDVFKDPSGYEKPECQYTWNNLSTHEIQLCDEHDARVKLKVNAVQQTDASGTKHTLAGWLHFEVELVDPNDSIRMVYAQMSDEHYNAWGSLRQVSERFQVSSAGGAQPWCPLHLEDERVLVQPALRITPHIFILTSKNIDKWKVTTKNGTLWDKAYTTLMQQGDWKMYRKTLNQQLHPDWFGAADIKHPKRGPLQCINPIFKGPAFNETLTREAPWILGLYKHKVSDEFFYPKNLRPVATVGGVTQHGSITCQQSPYFIKEYAHFVGRCLHHIDEMKRTSHDYFQTCNNNASSDEFANLTVNFTHYQNYTQDLYAFRNASCKNPCQPPKTEMDAVNISNFVDPLRGSGTEKISVEQTHKHRSQTGVAKFWRGRKFHGILCIICTMFVTPVSLFAARYYKETGMKHVFAGIQIWYWIHVANSLGLFAIYFSSQMAIRPSITSWGHSVDAFATIHYVLGWVSHGIFTLMLVFGGVRGGTHGSAVKVRKIVMAAHSFVGFAQYWINIFLVLISTWIPASPTVDKCDENGVPTGLSTVAILTFAWAGLDIMFHSLLMMLQVSVDTRLGFQRACYCPIVPIVSPEEGRDMRGSTWRRIVFILYLGTSGGLTIATVLNMILKSQVPGCVFGEMTCKSPVGCTSSALAVCKHLRYVNCEG
ncbi:hypothetical protein Ocin01_17314 [Orchesella cincta]|uniref:Ferric-chelate reductase 1 n=1 Tax=Orchesella cincta TaxID=48709 RepID=A0A1D2M8S0_ORCCI|nr:hypothetical protein Ocin01_17314 [Orchesella cincta]